ncbi:hypothetical protein IAT38_002565 [Cryptococcus sp. DSM 104549]
MFTSATSQSRPEPSTDAVWSTPFGPDGLAITTSDNVLFHVPIEVLVSRSRVFDKHFHSSHDTQVTAEPHRNDKTPLDTSFALLKLSSYSKDGDQHIFFDDPSCETSEVLRLVLAHDHSHALSGQLMPSPSAFLGALLFAQKWDCPRIQEGLEQSMRGWCEDVKRNEEVLSLLDIFVIASIVRRPELAAEAIRNHVNDYSVPPPYNPLENISGEQGWGYMAPGALFRTGFMPLSAWRAVPLEYMAALAMAEAESGEDDRTLKAGRFIECIERLHEQERSRADQAEKLRERPARDTCDDTAAHLDARWRAPDGDAVLVSSDGVTFMIPSYYLQSNSVVLRQALQMQAAHPPSQSSPHSNRTELSDPDCETADSLRLFLSIAAGDGDPHEYLCNSTSTTIVGTLQFCIKYDCPLILYTIRHSLRALSKNRLIYNAVGSLDLFILATKLGFYNLALDVVRTFDPRPKVSPRAHWGNVPHGASFTPGNFPMAAWQEIPVEWLWALAAVTRREGISLSQERQATRMAELLRLGD